MKKSAVTNLRKRQIAKTSTEPSTIPYEEALNQIRNLILTWEFDPRPWIDETDDGQLEDDKKQQEEQRQEEDDEIRIDEDSVAAKLKEKLQPGLVCGTNVIRRALVALAYEQLLDIRPKDGTFIRRITGDELSQLVKSRSVLEELFVCTIARNNHPNVYARLEDARMINLAIRNLAKDKKNFADPAFLLGKVLDYDMAFHEQLALLAGFDHLKSQLRSIRNRLRLASRKVITKPDHLRQLADDHDAILTAIRPRIGAWLGDIDRARLAMKTHLRNAVERLHLTDAIMSQPDYANDPMMDLPQQLSERNITSPVSLGVLRLLLELLVVAEISHQNTAGRLLIPTMLCKKMNEFARTVEGKSKVDDLTRAAFVSLDMQFHSSMAYISGLLFAQEALVHIWQRMYDDAEREITSKQMAEVVGEHNEILAAIGYFSGTKRRDDGLKVILDAVTTHFFESQRRVRTNSERGKNVRPNSGKRDDAPLVPPEVENFLKWFTSEIVRQNTAQR